MELETNTTNTAELYNSKFIRWLSNKIEEKLYSMFDIRDKSSYDEFLSLNKFELFGYTFMIEFVDEYEFIIRPEDDSFKMMSFLYSFELKNKLIFSIGDYTYFSDDFFTINNYSKDTILYQLYKYYVLYKL